MTLKENGPNSARGTEQPGRHSGKMKRAIRWTCCARADRRACSRPTTMVDEIVIAVVDGILLVQSKANADYFVATCGRAVDKAEARAIEAAFLKAYRWQYIHSGAQHPQFGKVLSSLITKNQGQRIQAALATIQ
jgi:hypothetical protein